MSFSFTNICLLLIAELFRSTWLYLFFFEFFTDNVENTSFNKIYLLFFIFNFMFCFLKWILPKLAYAQVLIVLFFCFFCTLLNMIVNTCILLRTEIYYLKNIFLYFFLLPILPFNFYFRFCVNTNFTFLFTILFLAFLHFLL